MEEQNEQEPRQQQQQQQHPREQQKWQQQGRGRGLRSARAQVVQGTANLAQARAGWQAAPKDIFVYHTSNLTTTDDIKDVIKETANIDTLKVEKRSREHSYLAPFSPLLCLA